MMVIDGPLGQCQAVKQNGQRCQWDAYWSLDAAKANIPSRTKGAVKLCGQHLSHLSRGSSIQLVPADPIDPLPPPAIVAAAPLDVSMSAPSGLTWRDWGLVQRALIQADDHLAFSPAERGRIRELADLIDATMGYATALAARVQAAEDG